MILNHPMEVKLVLFASNVINVSRKDLMVNAFFGSIVTVASFVLILVCFGITIMHGDNRFLWTYYHLSDFLN